MRLVGQDPENKREVTTQLCFRKVMVILPGENREGTAWFLFYCKAKCSKGLVTSNDNFIMLTNSVGQEVGQGLAGMPYDVWGLSWLHEPNHLSNCVFTHPFHRWSFGSGLWPGNLSERIMWPELPSNITARTGLWHVSSGFQNKVFWSVLCHHNRILETIAFIKNRFEPARWLSK